MVMEGLSLDQLRCFVAACELGSFSAAARKLGKGQPVISSHIQNMEADLNLELFDRNKKYPQPTLAAMSLLSHARQVIAQESRFLQAAQSYHCGEEPLLSIIFEEIVMPDKLNDVLAALTKKFPHTQIKSMTGAANEITDKISEGKADFAFVSAQEAYSSEIDFINLGQQHVLMVASPDHPLVGQKAASLSMLTDYRQIVMATGDERWALASQVWYCDSVQQTLELACRGVGWASASPATVGPYLKSGKLVELNIVNARKAWTLGVDLLWSSKTPKGLAAKWFAREAGRLYGNYYRQPIDFIDGN